MRKIIVIVAFLLSVRSQGSAQQVGDYEFLQVPYPTEQLGPEQMLAFAKDKNCVSEAEFKQFLKRNSGLAVPDSNNFCCILTVQDNIIYLTRVPGGSIVDSQKVEVLYGPTAQYFGSKMLLLVHKKT